MADRTGFVIPNADQVGGNYPVAEADKGDFLVLGNGRYGVVSGCEVVSLGAGAFGLSGGGPHVCVVDGVPYTVTPATVSVPDPTTGGRFSLVVFDSTTGVGVVHGPESSKPVFPDITSTMTVLGAIYAPALSAARVLTDKRALVQPGVWAVAVSGSEKVLTAWNSSGDERFSITAAGTLTWSNGAVVEPVGTRSVKITDTLLVDHLTVGVDGTVDGVPIPTRLIWGDGDPNVVPVSGDQGDLYVDDATGVAYIYRDGQWEPLDGPTNQIVITFGSRPGPGYERISFMRDYRVVLAESGPDLLHTSTSRLDLTLSPPLTFWQRV